MNRHFFIDKLYNYINGWFFYRSVGLLLPDGSLNDRTIVVYIVYLKICIRSGYFSDIYEDPKTFLISYYWYSSEAN